MGHEHLVREYSMIPVGVDGAGDLYLTVEVLRRDNQRSYRGYGRVKSRSAGRLEEFQGTYDSLEEALILLRGEALLRFPYYWIICSCHSDLVRHGQLEAV